MTCVAHQVAVVEMCNCGNPADGYADRTHGWCKPCLRGEGERALPVDYMQRENLFVLQPRQRE